MDNVYLLFYAPDFSRTGQGFTNRYNIIAVVRCYYEEFDDIYKRFYAKHNNVMGLSCLILNREQDSFLRETAESISEVEEREAGGDGR